VPDERSEEGRTRESGSGALPDPCGGDSSRAIRGHDREFIASDYAFRAMKDLVRADGDVSYLNDLDLAALRWAGVLPADRSTWFLRAGGDVR